MANRVILDRNGLRISAPGVNVLTAGDRNLYFNSSWSAVEPWRRGEAVVGPNNSQRYPFGKRFPRRPMVITVANVDAQEYQCVNEGGVVRDLGGAGDPDFRWIFRINIDDDAIRIRNNSFETALFTYTVWDIDI